MASFLGSSVTHQRYARVSTGPSTASSGSLAKFAAMRRAACNGLVNNRGCASITGPVEGTLLLTLVGYPNTANADTWDHGGDGDKSIYYLVWPADDGPKRVRFV